MKGTGILLVAVLLLSSLLPIAVQSAPSSPVVAPTCPTTGPIFVGNHVVDLSAAADYCPGGDVYWKRDGVELLEARGQLFYRDSGLAKGSTHSYERCCTTKIPNCVTPSNRQLGYVSGSICKDLSWSGGTYEHADSRVYIHEGAALTVSGATLKLLNIHNWTGPSDAPIPGGELRIQDSTLEDVRLEFGAEGTNCLENSTYSEGEDKSSVWLELTGNARVTLSGNTFYSTTIDIDGADGQYNPGPSATIAQNKFYDSEIQIEHVHAATTDISSNQFFYAEQRALAKGGVAIKQNGSRTAIIGNSFHSTGSTGSGRSAVHLAPVGYPGPLAISKIENNTVQGYDRISPHGGGDSGFRFAGAQITLNGNILTGNYQGLYMTHETQVTGEGNTFVGNEIALSLNASQSVSKDVIVTLRNSCVAGNTYGVQNMTAGIDAKSNWWGSASGPYDPTRNPGGQGDEITGSEGAFSPWLSTDNCRTEPPASLNLELPSNPVPADGLTQVELHAVLSGPQGPVPGATVRFQVPAGMGHVWPTSAVTDAQGRATVQYQVPSQDAFRSAAQAGILNADTVPITARSSGASDSDDLPFLLDRPIVKEINAYGIGTLNEQPETGSPVLLVASYTEPVGYKVEGCVWDGTMNAPVTVSAPNGGLCTYLYVPHSFTGSHGVNRAGLALAFEHTASGLVGLSLYQQPVDLYFARDGLVIRRKEPNWLVYWARDGAVPLLTTLPSDVVYDPTLGPETLGLYRAYDEKLVLGPAAATVDPGITVAPNLGCPGLTSPPVEGIRAVHRTLILQFCNHKIAQDWGENGLWRSYRDFDDSTPNVKLDVLSPADDLPDYVEREQVGTRYDDVDSCNMAQFDPSASWYGDQEFYCQTVGKLAPGKKVVPHLDWANPGERAGGLGTAASNSTLAAAVPASRSGPSSRPRPDRASDPPSATEFAQMAGTYADTGHDVDGDSLYDQLQLSIGVNVNQAEKYNLVAWLEGSSGTPIAWAGTHASLAPGSRTVDVLFDGQLIRDSGIAGPYKVGLVELRLGPRELVIDAPQDVHTTAAYALADFDPPDAAVAGTYSDQGVDTGSDGLFDLLRIDVGIDVTQSGTYTVTGELTKTAAIAVGQATANLTSGSRTVSLDFDGPSIFSHRRDGPYQFQSLRVENAAGELVHLVADAYTTGAHAHTAFQHGATTFDASSYSDQGVDSNGNGRFDSLRLSAGIDVAQAGTYTLLAHLADSDGSPLHSVAKQAALGTGKQTVHILFSGLVISAHGQDGPYQIQSLSLLDDEGTLVDSHVGAHTTAAYDWTEFEFQAFVFLPIVLRGK